MGITSQVKIETKGMADTQPHHYQFGPGIYADSGTTLTKNGFGSGDSVRGGSTAGLIP
jgi:hypothetical protein